MSNSFTPDLVSITLRDLFPDFVHYVIAFLLIAALWVIHHMQFHKIHYVDHNLLWMTIGSLLFVALIPFSTDLVGDFPTNPLCAFIFELNLLITSALFYLQWSYATANRHLIDPLMSDETIRAGKQRAAGDTGPFRGWNCAGDRRDPVEHTRIPVCTPGIPRATPVWP